MSMVLPAVNSLCRVVLGEADERPSRVESSEDGLLVVAAPWHAASLAPAPGDPLSIRWPSVRGICEVAATLVSVERERSIPLWTVQTEGQVQILQRRRFVRADATVPVTVAPLPAEALATIMATAAPVAGSACEPGPAPEPVLATAVNLSEGGARCRVEGLGELAAKGLVEDGAVDLRISLGAAVVHVVGLVIRITPEVPWTAKDAAEVVIAFDAPEHAGDLIRQFVLHQQVLARRAARNL
jgi:hypothetical protein